MFDQGEDLKLGAIAAAAELAGVRPGRGPRAPLDRHRGRARRGRVLLVEREFGDQRHAIAAAPTSAARFAAAAEFGGVVLPVERELGDRRRAVAAAAELAGVVLLVERELGDRRHPRSRTRTG